MVKALLLSLRFCSVQTSVARLEGLPRIFVKKVSARSAFLSDMHTSPLYQEAVTACRNKLSDANDGGGYRSRAAKRAAAPPLAHARIAHPRRHIPHT